MLEECLTYLKESIRIVTEPDFLKGGTVALRMKKLRHDITAGWKLQVSRGFSNRETFAKEPF